MAKNKVIVIGLDGATLDIIRPMKEAGKLPVIAKLMDEGVWGELESTIPPDTAPAWVSMMTGVNPGKHGVFFFLDNLHLNYGLGRTLGAADIKFPPIWKVLNENDKTVAFVNVPFTYPAVKVKGVMVSGMFIPSGADVLSYPPELYPELVKRIGRYDIDDWSPEVIGMSKTQGTAAPYMRAIEEIAAITESRKKAALIILEEKEWDYAMVVFTSIDRLQHLFWKAAGAPSSSEYSDAIYNGYEQADRALGELIEKAGKDTTVIITSDHGFGPLEKHFYVNKWLEEIGLLRLKKGVGPKKLVMAAPSLHKIARRLFSISLPEWTKKVRLPLPVMRPRDKDEQIDWASTRAYGNQSGININLIGREPRGSVDASEREAVLQKIEAEFKKLSDDSGKLIGDWIKRKEDIFTGPFCEDAVDLYFSVKERSYLQNSKLHQRSKWGDAPLSSGMHRMNGTFIMNGPFCRKGVEITPRIIDVTPTILYLMGVPLLEDMDGRVLEEGITAEYLKSHTIKKTTSMEHNSSGEIFSDEDETRIKESLKGLGYLS